ncbi:MAG: RNA polymerase subunit sigma [Nanoarchaeota archaeon]|nr:RNA polymerase subunit sigma [Nanoarchaeota archaeon]
MTVHDDVTAALAAIRAGDRKGQERLLELLYPELRRLAGQKMRSERESHTLQPTALIGEVYLRLFRNQSAQDWRDRAHFMATAAQAMGRILLDHARRRCAAKRPKTLTVTTLPEVWEATEVSHDLLLDVATGLQRLAMLYPDEGMEIGDGDAASAVFARIAMGRYPEEEAKRLLGLLREYCKQDTLAMVRLHEALLAV